MEDIFKVGNEITTNGKNLFKIIAVNDLQIACEDMLCGDLDVFSKTEHDFRLISKNDIVAKLELINIDLRYMMSISGKSKDAYGYCIDKIIDLIDGL